MIDKDLVGKRGCFQEHNMGKVEAKLEEHEHDIEELKNCVEHKRRRLDSLEIVDATAFVNFQNLEKRVDAKELKDEKRHNELLDLFHKAIGELGGKFNKVEKLLNRIMWVGIGGIGVLTFIFLLFEKVPAMIETLQKIF